MPTDRPRRPTDPFAAAEAAFRKGPPPAEAAPKKPVIPGARQVVSIRLDEDVIEYFQAEGPGWQERINAVLRKSMPQ